MLIELCNSTLAKSRSESGFSAGATLLEVSVVAMNAIELDKPVDEKELHTSVEEAIHHCLFADTMYGFYCQRVRFEWKKGVLTLRGSVPTYDLKQLLETRLANVPGVEHIDNQIDVVNSWGLSSVRPQ